MDKGIMLELKEKLTDLSFHGAAAMPQRKSTKF